MPIIRASCPACGDVDILPEDMTIMVCVSDGQTSYVFRCPVCMMAVSREVDRRIMEILVSAGVKVHFWRLPSELSERPEGPPINLDDLIDFHYELAAPNWLERLLRFSSTEGE